MVGLGCNNFGRRIDLEATRAVVDAALDDGRHVLRYSQHLRPRAERGVPREVLEGRRDQVTLATKFGMDMGDGKGPRGSRDYILQAIEASLRRLRTDTIDVYWYHRPDGVTPIAETLEALDELVRRGSVRAIGASNFSAQQLEEADAVARERGLTRFAAVQNEYSLLVRDAERDVLPACERLGIGFVPFFPLASGLLTGKYRRGEAGPSGARLSDRERDRVRRAVRPARCTPALRRRAGCLVGRRRDRCSDRAPGDLVGDRGCDQAGAGPRQCRRRPVAAERRGHGRARGAAGSAVSGTRAGDVQLRGWVRQSY